MAYTPTPFNPQGTVSNQVFLDLTAANNNFIYLSTLATNQPGFPQNASINQVVAVNGSFYYWNGTTWVAMNSAVTNLNIQTTATPNAIPESLASGQLDPSWIPTNVTVKNAQMLNGLQPSVIAQANSVPISSPSGLLDPSWIPPVNPALPSLPQGIVASSVSYNWTSGVVSPQTFASFTLQTPNILTMTYQALLILSATIQIQAAGFAQFQFTVSDSITTYNGAIQTFYVPQATTITIKDVILSNTYSGSMSLNYRCNLGQVYSTTSSAISVNNIVTQYTMLFV
jgi:hypothetical protein